MPIRPDMLTIRREQLHALENAARESWVNRMIRSIAKDYPRQFEVMGESRVRAFILRAIEKGRANHVETQGGISVLADLMIQFGEDFQNSRDRKWGQEILAHSELPAGLKMTLLYRRMTELSQGRVIVPFNVQDGA